MFSTTQFIDEDGQIGNLSGDWVISGNLKKNYNNCPSQILTSCEEAIDDLKNWINCNSNLLIGHFYNREDQPTIHEITSGLHLDHIGILLPCQWIEVEGFVSSIGDNASVLEAPSVLVRRNLYKRYALDLHVNIHLVSFSNLGYPKLEIFTIEEEPLKHIEMRLSELQAGYETHLAFRVPPHLADDMSDRLNRFPINETMKGEHKFTGQTMGYYKVDKPFNPFKRHLELLLPNSQCSI